jgi:hypothetical protein
MNDSVKDFVLWLATLDNSQCSSDDLRMIAYLANLFLGEINQCHAR